MKSEIFRFLYFLLLLSCISSFVSEFHTKDKSYLYADAGITEIQSQEKGFVSSYIQFWKSLVLESGGKTENGETVYSHIGTRFFSTLHLAIFSILFGSIFAFGLSLAATYFRSGLFYDIVSFSSHLILSTPIFIVAILLLLLFFTSWNGFHLVGMNQETHTMLCYLVLHWVHGFMLGCPYIYCQKFGKKQILSMFYY